MFCARMMAVVDTPQSFAAHMCVDLGRPDIRVAEHELQAPQIGPTLEQVSREGMPHDVR